MITLELINKYIEAKGETPDQSKFLLKDAGQGNFIARWDYEFPQPNPAQLQQYNGIVQQEEAARLAALAKLRAMPSNREVINALLSHFQEQKDNGGFIGSDLDKILVKVAAL